MQQSGQIVEELFKGNKIFMLKYIYKDCEYFHLD
jgi:hypothetical protein